MSATSLHEFAAAPIEECYRQIERPQHAELRKLLALWDKRPADGFQVGRDIPSRRFAPLLSHILFWEPIDSGVDYRLHLCGEALRLRFGDNAIGKPLTELLGPDVIPFFLDTGRKMLAKDYCACFDMNLVRQEAIEGRNKLHFELVIFPVWSHDRSSRWILNGTYYFL